MTTSLSRPCDGNHPGREAYRGEYTEDQCGVCWRYLNDERYHKLWGGPGLKPAKPKCRHLGSLLEERGWCPSCPNDTQGHRVPLLACSLHGKTAGQRFAHGVRTCVGCPDYQVPDDLAQPVVRNLLYHIWPVRGEVWRWNVQQLLRRIELFNGRRIVAVVTDSTTDAPGAVEEAFQGKIDEFVVMQNAPELREVLTFEPLFRRVQSRHPSHVTFYGQAKGVSRPWHSGIRDWATLLYESTLGHWPVVLDLLQRYPVVGALKKIGRGWPDHESLSPWHYSGSFYWLRHRDLFSRPDWARIERFWSGIETYPSMHYSAQEAGCVFWEKPALQVNLYNTAYLEVVTQAWERWKAEHAHQQTCLSAGSGR